MARPLEENSKGKRPTRPSEIEAAINVGLEQDLETLKKRAGISDKASPEYLPSECLVHLIRNSVRQSNSGDPSNIITNTLFRLLLKRCEENLKSTVSSTIGTAEDIREEILGRLSDLFAEDFAHPAGRRLDFYEIRFGRAFKLLRIDVVRSELKRINRLDNSTKVETVEETVSGEGIEGNISDPNFDLSFLEDKIESEERRAWLSTAMLQLTEPEHRALMLRFSGYKIESTDPKERTIATICNVSGRTIQARLKKALSKLTKLKEAS